MEGGEDIVEAAFSEALQQDGCPPTFYLRKKVLGERGATSLVEHLLSDPRFEGITALHLENTELKAKGCKALAECLREHNTHNIHKNNNNHKFNNIRTSQDYDPNNLQIQTLEIWNDHIGPDGAKSLADSLRGNNTLTLLDLSYCWIGDAGIKSLADSLQGSSTLLTLNLSRNKIKTKGCKALADSLQPHTSLSGSLTRLVLSSNEISKKGAVALATAFKNGGATALRSLSLTSAKIGDAGTVALAESLVQRCNMLQSRPPPLELQLEYNEIGVEGGKILAESLYANTLSRLSLFSNNMGEGVTPLADSLHTNTSLLSLDLRSTQIGPEQVMSLAGALRNNTSLTRLLLGENSIGTEGGIVLAETLRVNDTLRELSVCMDDDGAIALAETLQTNTTLTDVWLESYRRQVGGKKGKEQADDWTLVVGVRGARALAGALHTTSTLHSLHVGGSEKAREIVEEAKSHNYSMQERGANQIRSRGVTETSSSYLAFDLSVAKLQLSQSLTKVVLRYCNLLCVPPEIYEIKSLQVLDLGYVIPSCLHNPLIKNMLPKA